MLHCEVNHCGPRAAARARRGALAVGALAAAMNMNAWAETPAQPIGLPACAAIENDADRLACYDRLAGRQPPAPAAAQPQPDTVSRPAPLPQPVPTAESPVGSPAGEGLRPPAGTSLWSRFWELDPQDKRGTFNFRTYRPNFLLPVHYTSSINRAPTSPTRPAPTERLRYKPLEAKLQLSLRTKIAQSVLLPHADVWFGYTQQSLWQVWNPSESAPFRNTDYEPEVIYVVPVPEGLARLPGGWRWSMAQAGVAHQSNGQSEPLSRSWNRVYLAAGFERGELTVLARVHKRLRDGDDDNPDLTTHLGRGDVALAWAPGRATASLRWRTNFKDLKRGSWQLDWTYPVDEAKPDGLRWYVQLFSGYGETLIDYNRRQTSIGTGLTLFEF